MRRPLSTIELTAEQEDEVRRFVKEMIDKEKLPAKAQATPSPLQTKRTSPRRAASTTQSSEGDLMDLE